MTALREHLDEIYDRFCHSDIYKSGSRKLIASVMKKRFGDFAELPPLTNLGSSIRVKAERGGRTIEKSLEIQPTTEGILLNLSLLARYRALVSQDFDMACRFGSESRGLRSEQINAGHSWFTKPLWAWSSKERLFTEAIGIAEDLIAALPMKVRVTLSNLDDCGVETTSPWNEGSTSDSSLRLLYHQPMLGPEPVDSEDVINSCMNDDSSAINLVRFKNSQTLATRLNPVTDDNKLPTNEHTSSQPNHVVTVTPEGSQGIDRGNLGTASETVSGEEVPSYAAARALHIDSDGIDMTVLSQLPPTLRSEVRVAMAVKAREKKRRARSHGKIWDWLVETKVGTRQSHDELDRSLKPSLLERQGGKRARTISEYFKR